MIAYKRRKEFEHRAQAVAIGKVIAELFGGSSGGKGRAHREVSTDAMFELIGLDQAIGK